MVATSPTPDRTRVRVLAVLEERLQEVCALADDAGVTRAELVRWLTDMEPGGSGRHPKGSPAYVQQRARNSVGAWLVLATRGCGMCPVDALNALQHTVGALR